MSDAQGATAVVMTVFVFACIGYAVVVYRDNQNALDACKRGNTLACQIAVVRADEKTDARIYRTAYKLKTGRDLPAMEK